MIMENIYPDAISIDIKWRKKLGISDYYSTIYICIVNSLMYFLFLFLVPPTRRVHGQMCRERYLIFLLK